MPRFSPDSRPALPGSASSAKHKYRMDTNALSSMQKDEANPDKAIEKRNGNVKTGPTAKYLAPTFTNAAEQSEF